MTRLYGALVALLMFGGTTEAQTIETVTLLDVTNPRINNGLVVDGSGVVFASDIFSQTGQLTGTRVFRVEPNGVASTVGVSFAQPAGLAIDRAGRLYVANFTGNRISRVLTDGTIETFFFGGLDRPSGLAFGPDGRLYVTNYDAASVVAIDSAGNSTVIASGGPMSFPVGIAFDDDGVLYVALHLDGKIVGSGAVVVSR